MGGQGAPADEEFVFQSLEIPGAEGEAAGLESEIDADGVFQFYRRSVVGEGGPIQHFQSTEYAHWSVGQGKAPVFQVPSTKEYSVDLD